MGSVWVAEHLALHTQVAVKFLSPDLAQDPESVARFKHEAAAASQVKSPHVVQTFDNGVTEDGLLFIVMELLEGEDLTHRLRSGPLPPSLVGQIVWQVGKALGRAHEKGIVHRDIKPDNIFLCETDEDGEIFCKLLDFGVAKGGLSGQTLSGHTATGSMVGTPYYMSPEQAVSARDIDYRSDLWSLGMVAFEALTGRRALDADSLGALVLALHTSSLPAPREFDASLPPELDQWFAVACAKLPRDRFQSAREMCDALLSIVGGGKVRHRSDPESSDTSRFQVTERDRLAFAPAGARGSTATFAGQRGVMGGHHAAPPGRSSMTVLEGLDEPFANGRLAPAALSSTRAPTLAAAPSVPISEHVPPLDAETLKVPSLMPPPMTPRRQARGEDEDWKQLIDRSNGSEAPVGRSSPTPQHRRTFTPVLPNVEQRPSAVPVVLGVLVLGALLLTAITLYLHREEAVHVLFPGLSPSASGATPQPGR